MASFPWNSRQIAMNSPFIAEYFFLLLFAGIASCLAKPAIRWWRRRPWQIRGLPLRGAEVVLEGITPLPSPSVTAATGDDVQLRNYFEVNVTIKPVGRLNKAPWMPADLKVVPAERWNPQHPDDGDLGRYCRIESMELVCGAISFEPDEAFCVVGKFDLRLCLSARHDIRFVQFRYYLEQFGAFELPAPVSAIRPYNNLLIRPQPVASE
jgi:hypothetical protein